MFILNPSHLSFFEFQLKHILHNLWLNEFDYTIQNSMKDKIKTRCSRMGIKGNRYTNFIAQLYGYNSYSELIAAKNGNSTFSMWIVEHDAFKQDDNSLYENARQALAKRANLILKDHDILLAKSFVLAVKKLPMLNKDTLPDVFWDKPFSAAIHSLSLSLSDIQGFTTSRKDDVDPDYDWDGHASIDDTPYYSLREHFVFRDKYEYSDISPYFYLADDAEDFFIEYGKLYCKYLINVNAREVDHSLSKISNLDNIANSVYISPKRF